MEAELAALVPDQAVAPEETAALPDLIETRYHAMHRRELPIGQALPRLALLLLHRPVIGIVPLPP